MLKGIKGQDIIEDITYKSSNQGIGRRLLYNLGTNKIKLLIESDAYKCQCHANAYILNTNSHEWKLIYNIPYSEMNTEENLESYTEYKNNPILCKDKFSSDIERLNKYVSILLK